MNSEEKMPEIPELKIPIHSSPQSPEQVEAMRRTEVFLLKVYEMVFRQSHWDRYWRKRTRH